MLITSSNLYQIKAEVIALSYTNSSAAVIHAHPNFTQRVINVWNNYLPMSVEFGSLSAFTKSIGRVNLNQFLRVNGCMHSVCIFVFIVGLVYIYGYCIRKYVTC